MTDDYSLALRLQLEYDQELKNAGNILEPDTETLMPPPLQRSKRKRDNAEDLNATQNIVHPEWETLDPTPDIFALFGAFNVKFFEGKLSCVQLEWSKKMYSCAGICYSRRNYNGMSCTIRLSEPLLKLRQRKDLVETLLHEMIHAFLFVLNIRESNGGHGPNFKKIMERINRTAGTNISVYHTFHDEVKLYKTHVWRCNGICKERQPFFGYVRRTSNRAPSHTDFWWAQHKETCGGYFQKISEPEPKKRGPKALQQNKVESSTIQSINHPKWGMNTDPKLGSSSFDLTTSVNSASRTVTKPTVINTTTTPNPRPKSKVGGNLTNVFSFKDLSDSDSDSTPKRVTPLFPTIGGHKLGTTPNHKPANSSVRDIWSNRFSSPKVSNESSSWEIIDDDVQIREPINEIIELGDSDSDDSGDLATQSMPKLTTDERQKQIKKEILDPGDDDSDIELVDDDFDDELATTGIQLSDTSVIDDIFGSDTLMSDFYDINVATPSASKTNKTETSQEIISCPICTSRMCRDQFEEHLNGCMGITVKVDIAPPCHNKKRKQNITPFASTSRPAVTERDLLLSAGYSEEVADRVLLERKEEKRYNDRILNEIQQESTTLACPICQAVVPATAMNDHIDGCIDSD